MPTNLEEQATKNIPAEALPASPKSGQRSLRPRKSTVPAAAEGIPLENVTTRLRHDTNERLTEAALHQKLKKVRPNTRQDIIEAALQDGLGGEATSRPVADAE